MVYFFSTSGNGIIATATENLLSKEDIEKLCWLYSGATPVDAESVEGYFVGPRREMITPWSRDYSEYGYRRCTAHRGVFFCCR